MSDPPWFSPLLRPALASLKAYVPEPCRPDAVRLDANEAPDPLSPEERAHLGASLAAVPMHRYPDVRATRLRELVAERAGAHPDEVILGVGSDEAIALLVHALSNPRSAGSQAVFACPSPTFVMYQVDSILHGARPVTVPLDARWDLDVEAFSEVLTRDAPNAVFLPSPNNPTSNLFSLDRVLTLVERAPGALVVLDEAYGPFSGVTYSGLRSRYPHVGQLQTLSKVGFAAARVGWAIVPRALAREVDKVRQPYNLSALSQRAAELALTDLAPAVARGVARVLAERPRLAAALSSLPGFVVHPSDANFLWVSVPGDAGALHAALLRRGVVVRSFHASGGRLARMLRVTVGTPDQTDALTHALRAALSSGEWSPTEPDERG